MYIRQAIDLLEGLFTGTDDNKELAVHHVQKLIVFAIMWSLGALLELDDRKKVSDTVSMFHRHRHPFICLEELHNEERN